MFDYSNIQKNYFDKKRHEFLAAIFDRNFGEVERIYKDILYKIDTSVDLSEVDLKALHQIQHALRRFRSRITGTLGQNIQADYERVRKHLTMAARGQIKAVKYVAYDAWFKKIGLTREQFRIMLKTIASLQITIGCSLFCRRCNEWALPGPRKHFSFDAVKRLIKELFDVGNTEFILYGASDPLDWRWRDKNVMDIWAFMSGHGYKPRYGLLTKIPRGSEKTVENLLMMGADIGFSITDRNRSKLERIENATGMRIEVQHDFDELLIPARLDEDFTTIKSSITDNYGTEITPEGAFLVIPTFTSALNPTGQCRIPITAEMPFFLKKRVGRDALPVEYFKPLQAIDLKGKEFFPNSLFEAQIENILLDDGSEDLTPPGMMNLREYFRTYAPEAVRRRKTLGNFDSCQLRNVIQYKKNAFSYYLKRIAGYLKTHPTERKIILHLRKKDRARYEKGYHQVWEGGAGVIHSLLEESGQDTFALFQILMFMLLDNPENETVQKFVKDTPAEAIGCFW